jgi:hypothetical protein
VRYRERDPNVNLGFANTVNVPPTVTLIFTTILRKFVIAQHGSKHPQKNMLNSIYKIPVMPGRQDKGNLKKVGNVIKIRKVITSNLPPQRLIC